MGKGRDMRFAWRYIRSIVIPTAIIGIGAMQIFDLNLAQLYGCVTLTTGLWLLGLGLYGTIND